MSKGGRTLIAFTAVLIIDSLAAAVGLMLDPIQPEFDAAAPTLAIGGSSEQQLAQTLTIGREGTMVGLFLPLGCASGRLVVEIRTVDGGEPGDIVLRRRRFRAEDLDPVVSAFRLLPLPGLPVATGDSLAVVLRNPSGSCGIVSGPVGDPYPGGEGFFDARPNPPGWIPIDLGTGRHDLPFQVVVRDR